MLNFQQDSYRQVLPPAPTQPQNRRKMNVPLRTSFILGTIVYLIALQACYILILPPIWSYLGYVYNTPPLAYWLFFSVLAVLPSLWMPIRMNRPSEWIYLSLYAVVYLPICFVPLFARSSLPNTSLEDLLLFNLMLFACFSLLGSIYKLPLLKLPPVRLEKHLFWSAIILFSVSACGLIYYVYQGVFSLEQWVAVRDQRMLHRSIVRSGLGSITGYALNWVGYGIGPFLIACGLRQRRIWLSGIGLFAVVFVFSATAGRMLMANVAILFMLYFAFRYRRELVSVRFIWILSGIIIASTLICLLVPSVRSVTSLILLRTFMGPAYVTGLYQDFFSENPQTKFSHVSGLSWMADNPYEGKALGLVLGEATGDAENQLNGNMWADGYAGLGIAGMFIVTFIAAVVFHGMDSALRKMDAGFAVLIISAHAFSLANIPLFTSLVGGGFGLSILLAFLVPSPTQKAPATRSPELSRQKPEP